MKIQVFSDLQASYKRFLRLLKVSLALSLAVLVLNASLLGVAYAAHALLIPEGVNMPVRKNYASWAHVQSNRRNVPAIVSKGIRSDTEKATRVIENRISGFTRNLRLDIAKEIRLNYEVYVRGAHRGKIYRVYKPSVTHTAKTARYLGIFRLTVTPKVSLLSYSINRFGEAVVVYKEQYVFTLPRQFPLKQNAFAELLRKSFKISSLPVTRTYTITPNSSFGRLVVSLSEY